MIGICKDCLKLRPLTRHSKIGGHQPPFVLICRKCHDERDGLKPPMKKQNKKIQKGTPYGKYKK